MPATHTMDLKNMANMLIGLQEGSEFHKTLKQMKTFKPDAAAQVNVEEAPKEPAACKEK